MGTWRPLGDLVSWPTVSCRQIRFFDSPMPSFSQWDNLLKAGSDGRKMMPSTQNERLELVFMHGEWTCLAENEVGGPRGGTNKYENGGATSRQPPSQTHHKKSESIPDYPRF